MVQRELGHLNPEVTRDGTSGARIDLDIADEHASTDCEAAAYALKALNQTLIPDDDARVIDVALDSTVEPDSAPVPEIESAPAEKEEPVIVDVEEVPLDQDEADEKGRSPQK